MSKEEDVKKKKKIQALKQRRQEALENKAGTQQIGSLNAGTEKMGAAKEQQVASRYKKDFDPRTVVPEGGPQPGVTSGDRYGKNFSLYTKNNDYLKKKKK